MSECTRNRLGSSRTSSAGFRTICIVTTAILPLPSDVGAVRPNLPRRRERMAVWDEFITERDRQVFADAGYGSRGGFGERPALLVVDVNHRFCGDRPLPILESIQRHRNSCGEEAWAAIPRIQELLAAARARGTPVFFSTGAPSKGGLFGRGRWASKN